jgi:hypothetical protein
MMSLWDPHGTLHVAGDPNSPYVGLAQLTAFWLGSGSFTHRRFSLVPSFKIQIVADTFPRCLVAGRLPVSVTGASNWQLPAASSRESSSGLARTGSAGR